MTVTLRNVVDFFRSTSWYANAVAIVALAAWLIKVLWLDDVSAFFLKAHELGEVVEITLSQVVASYVFYLSFVHKQEVDDRRAIAPYVNRHAVRIYGDCIDQLAEFSRVSSVEMDFDTVTEDVLRDAMKLVPTTEHPNMVMDLQMTKANWFQYFEARRVRTFESVSNLLDLGRLLQPELASRIVQVRECGHLLSAPMMVRFTPNNPTLENFSGSFWDYLVRCRRVKAWVDQHPIASGVTD